MRGSAGDAHGIAWVNAKGRFLAAARAGPVYRLLGRKDLGTTEFPPIETTLADGDLAFRQHSGGHTDGPNWPTFLTLRNDISRRQACAELDVGVAVAVSVPDATPEAECSNKRSGDQEDLHPNRLLIA
jgi:hypothetical protein